MRRPLLTKNCKIGYSVAVIFYLMACALLVTGWRFLGSAAAALAISFTLDTASAHKHLSKERLL